MAAIEWVLFDLDGTLWDHVPAADHAIATVAAGHGLDPARLRETFHDVNEQLWREVSLGEIDLPTLRVRRFREVLDRMEAGEGVSPDHVGDDYLAAYLGYQGELPGASKALETCAAMGARIAVLTNGGDDTQEAKLAQLRRQDLVEWMLTSDMAGAYKPSPDFFDRAERRLGFSPPETVLFVGDSWKADIVPGRDRGWRTAWISGGEPMPEPLPGVEVIASIAELPALLRRLAAEPASP
jgi:HAD superfamily hydrolase (TIGR01549 family)